MNEVENPEKTKNKTVGRISRLFQKKPKKKTMTSSLSSMSLSDPALSKQTILQSSSSSISSSQQSITTDSFNLSKITTAQTETGSIHSKLTRTMSMSSHNSMTIQQLISQQLSVLKELDSQKSMYKTQVTKLEEQLLKTKEKIQHRTHDMEILKSNYEMHLRSIRSSDDDAKSIGIKLLGLKKSIHVLASELLPFAEPELTSEKLSTLWLNLGQSIDQLGKPLPPERIQMLTEKFMMDVLVRNLNINQFPGLACDPEFLELSNWFEQNDSSLFFSTRLRQELSLIVVKNITNTSSDIEQSWKKCIDSNWHYLYRGLQKAYPSYLLSPNAMKRNDLNHSASHEYGKKLRNLVQETISLGSAIKGQEVSITAVDVREGMQSFDPKLMEDEDGQSMGTIAFCISPPFVVKISNRYEPLVKGRVLCFPTTDTDTVTTTTTITPITTTTT